MSARVVTVSATFGAGGSTIGPAVAERLGLPFVDRAVPVAVAAEIGCTLEEALTHDGRAETGIGRILAGAARLPNVTLGGMDVYMPDRTIVPEEEFVRRTERFINRVADEDGGVILGRAGALVLADRPAVLHVRLDGPRERRLERAGGDAARMLDDNDRARAAYVKHLYGADAADPRHYHLVIDSTRLPEPAVVDLVVAAAGAV
ncbi:AAA family ATPase [Spirillospora sp. CA-294931]|uniref:cytidylate kinase-like family protein n=1 Tax=Spirillospora sp. CA-294931 TaxID=3240042 RepID=UPI003D8C565F